MGGEPYLLPGSLISSEQYIDVQLRIEWKAGGEQESGVGECERDGGACAAKWTVVKFLLAIWVYRRDGNYGRGDSLCISRDISLRPPEILELLTFAG